MSDVDDASETEDYSWWRGHSGGGELTRSLCGPDRTLPRRIRLCSPFPPGRAGAAGTARSSSPGKRAPSPCRSN